MQDFDLHNEYKILLSKFGHPKKYWPQWCNIDKSLEERELVLLGMILVQRTTWHNANIALKNLKKNNLLSISKISGDSSFDQVKDCIRPAGFHTIKPSRLKDLCSFVTNNKGITGLMKLSKNDLRQKLLEIKGIGPETADTIMLYGLDKASFIIDEYTKRWLKIHIQNTNGNYTKLQTLFESNLPLDVELYQNFHALIIISQLPENKAYMEVV